MLEDTKAETRPTVVPEKCFAVVLSSRREPQQNWYIAKAGMRLGEDDILIQPGEGPIYKTPDEIKFYLRDQRSGEKLICHFSNEDGRIVNKKKPSGEKTDGTASKPFHDTFTYWKARKRTGSNYFKSMKPVSGCQ